MYSLSMSRSHARLLKCHTWALFSSLVESPQIRRLGMRLCVRLMWTKLMASYNLAAEDSDPDHDNQDTATDRAEEPPVIYY